MKHLHYLAVALFCLGLFASCSKDEPAGIEADIRSITLTGDLAQRLTGDARLATRLIAARDTDIVYTLAADADTAALRTLAPTFLLSDGATLRCLDGDNPDFRHQHRVTYEVTSQDRRYTRRYTLSFVPQSDIPSELGFEHFALNEPGRNYYTWFEADSTGGKRRELWANGNPGFMLTHYDAAPDEYPTSVTDEGRTGHAIRLVTRSTGALGEMFGKPIAAGNFFMGEFDLESAIMNSLASTHFGRPVNRLPQRLSGYYKWQPGEHYRNAKLQDAQGPGKDGKDAPRIYAVIYRNTDAEGKAVTLDGTNVLTSPLLIATAMLDDFRVTGVKKSDEWVHFDIPFVYTSQPQPELLDRRGYNLALVFTSSRGGAEFMGAVGSTLLVDDCRLSY